MQKADHSGHRSRLREKYLAGGIEVLAPHEIIEMLLFNAIPYRNTNDIAKNLIDRFGSLSDVFDAELNTLINAGLTRTQATYIKLIPDVTRMYLLDKKNEICHIIDDDTLGDYIATKFIGVNHEERVLLILMDDKLKEVFCGFIADGDFDSATFSTRRLLRMCISYDARAAVLAHNHPSGFAMPSRQDYLATHDLKAKLESIGVELFDHYIIADNDMVSMRQSNAL